MGTLPILQKGAQRPTCPPNASLPVYYMSDFSVLGFLVASLDEALQIAEANHFAVTRQPGGFDLVIERADQIQQLVDLFDQNGVDCTIADIIDQVYQG